MKYTEVINSSTRKRSIMNFSVDSEPVIQSNVTNFSEESFLSDPKYNYLSNLLENFTLLELIKLSSQNPRLVLRKRVQEVVRYVNASTPELVESNKYTITTYLNQYLFEQIMKCMNDPNIKQINLTYLLGLQFYVNDLNPVRDLQKFLTRSKLAVTTTGFLNKQLQVALKTYYTEVWDEFILGIEDKYFNKDKKGLLSNKVDNVVNEKATKSDLVSKIVGDKK